ncbi:MAG: Bacteriophage replication protein [Pseudomonadota bacterium]|jgi:phage replication O-like protein O
MSLAHTLIDSALAADLTQNELKIFLVLLRQTLCFGKSSDPLTTKRIAQLARIRKDRVLTAIKGFLQIGIFQTKPHKIFETEYFINEELLTLPNTQVLAPNLPKNRKTSHDSEILSEKWVHTINTHTTKNPNTTTEHSVFAQPSSRIDCSTVLKQSTEPLPYPKTFNTPEQQQAAQVLDGLSPTLAHDCLQVLNQALQTGKVLKPLAYLHQLAKAARRGTLDTSTLLAPMLQPTPTPHTNTALHTQLNHLANDIQGLDQLFKRAGVAMDALNLAKRTQWVKEYQHLSQQLAVDNASFRTHPF